MKTLTLDDLGEVYSALYPARAKWYNIGLAVTSITLSVLMLHPLRVSDLDSIKSQSSDPGICLREMLSVYLKSGGASWFDIIEALDQNIVGENQLAERLLEKVPEYEGNGDPGDSFHKGDLLCLLFVHLIMPVEDISFSTSNAQVKVLVLHL